MQEGKKIWVESILTPEEWNTRYKSGLGSSTVPWPPQEFDCEFKWRHNMGKPLSKQQIEQGNANLDKLKEYRTKLLQQELHS